MNQKLKKPLSDFTQKQRKAYKLAMKSLAKRELTRRQLFSIIRKAEIYSRKRDAKETTKMLIENPETPISVNSEAKLSNDVEVKKSAN